MIKPFSQRRYLRAFVAKGVGLTYCSSNVSLLLYPGQGWVGWRNDTRSGQPVEIKFEFDQVREFTAVHIFCNNQFTREVQVRNTT